MKERLVLEVQQQLGSGVVRAIVMVALMVYVVV
ncbi:hypothetical protein O9993_14655 [Vibrio lentus]|nr:hypothetical protein [Vibrio lentus]